MTTPICECCRQVIAPAATKDPRIVEGLCAKCNTTWAALGNLTPGVINHVLARCLCHSTKDICRRFGWISEQAHNQALRKAAERTGIDKAFLIRTGRWALITGRLERPAGFEDCNPNGWTPEHVKGTSEVKLIKTELAPSKPRKGGYAPEVKTRTPPPDTASPATPTAVEAASHQPGAAKQLPSLSADEPPADLDFETAMAAVTSAKRQIDDAFERLQAAQDAYQKAGEALLKCGLVA